MEAAYPEKNADSYTEESWSVYREALEAAKTISADEKAAQKTIVQALEALKAAWNSLTSIRDAKTLFSDVKESIII